MEVGAEWMAVPLERKLWRATTVSVEVNGRESMISSFNGGGGARAVDDIFFLWLLVVVGGCEWKVFRRSLLWAEKRKK